MSAPTVRQRYILDGPTDNWSGWSSRLANTLRRSLSPTPHAVCAVLPPQLVALIDAHIAEALLYGDQPVWTSDELRLFYQNVRTYGDLLALYRWLYGEDMGDGSGDPIGRVEVGVWFGHGLERHRPLPVWLPRPTIQTLMADPDDQDGWTGKLVEAPDTEAQLDAIYADPLDQQKWLALASSLDGAGDPRGLALGKLLDARAYQTLVTHLVRDDPEAPDDERLGDVALMWSALDDIFPRNAKHAHSPYEWTNTILGGVRLIGFSTTVNAYRQRRPWEVGSVLNLNRTYDEATHQVRRHAKGEIGPGGWLLTFLPDSRRLDRLASIFTSVFTDEAKKDVEAPAKWPRVLLFGFDGNDCAADGGQASVENIVGDCLRKYNPETVSVWVTREELLASKRFEAKRAKRGEDE